MDYAALKEHQVVESVQLLSRKKKSVTENKHYGKRGMILSFEPHCITFDEVTYSVDMPQVIYKHNKMIEKHLCLLNFHSYI